MQDLGAYKHKNTRIVFTNIFFQNNTYDNKKL
jgi:hypothetical protein